MQTKRFNGDKKEGKWLLKNVENELKKFLAPKVPLWLETYHLTLLTIVWNIGIICSGYLAIFSIQWLYLSSACIALQYVTDLLDGEIGRRRNTGLIKWGFYMDHLLDFFFLESIILSYVFLPTMHLGWLIAGLALASGFMVHSFLQFTCTNTFTISIAGIGPTEMRIGFIAVNTYIAFGNSAVVSAALPIVIIAGLAILIWNVYKTSVIIWQLDMSNHES
jgi:archaetidylinositol phosphate synthase